MAQLPYTKQAFIERVKRHLANGWPKSSFAISDNEILLLIDSYIPVVMKGEMFDNAKAFGIFETPEAYIVTYELSLTKDNATQEWVATLPQPPVSLPIGYSITRAYFSVDGFETNDVLWVKGKRTAYRNLLPKVVGIYGRVVGSELRLRGDENQSLQGRDVLVEMPTSRTTDKNEAMNLPDDAISSIFDSTVKTLLQRYMLPQDIIDDNLPAGNKAS